MFGTIVMKWIVLIKLEVNCDKPNWENILVEEIM